MNIKNLDEKYIDLQDYLRSLGSVAVAFSGGVDSTLLLKTALNVLGKEHVIAVTASSASFPERERNEAAAFCEENGISQYVFSSDELNIEGFRENPTNRCYLCKRQLFTDILKIAREQNMAAVAEGSNMDDNADYRPGMIAIRELGIKSPLREAQLYKEEIRELSRRLHLPTWSKPSFACLASRFVYGEPITEEKLGMVEKAEELLLSLGFSQVRVRIHGTIARIEVAPDAICRMLDEQIRVRVFEYLKSLGFSYVTLDLGGYRTGSMNETLTEEVLKEGIVNRAE